VAEPEEVIIGRFDVVGKRVTLRMDNEGVLDAPALEP
jgi:hypothetical protein